MTIKNEGPNNSYFAGGIYDVVPENFTFSSDDSGQMACQDMGLVDAFGAVFSNYTGQHLVACNVSGGPYILNSGASVEFNLIGTATSDFVKDTTTNNAVYFDNDYETSFMTELQNAVIQNQDIFMLESNNVSRATYTYSDPPTTPPTPTPPTNPPTPSTPATPSNPASPTTPKTNTPKKTPSGGGSSTPMPSSGGAADSDAPAPATPILPKNNTQTLNYTIDKKNNLKQFLSRYRDYANIFPWLLLLLLLIVALVYGWHGRAAYLQRKKMEAIHERLVNTNERLLNYLAITAHYLNTPLTILKSSLEMLGKFPTFANIIPHISNKLTGLQTTVQGLQTEQQKDKAETQLLQNSTQVFEHIDPSKPWKSPAVWLPVAICGSLLILINILLIWSSLLNFSVVRLVVEVLLFILSVVLVGFSDSWWHKQQVLVHQQQLANESESRLLASRQAFIDQSADTLKENYEDISIASQNIQGYQESKTYNNGLAMLEKIVTDLSNLKRFSKLSDDLPDIQAQSALQDLMPRLSQFAEEHQVQIVNNIDVSLKIQLQPEELDQLLTSTIQNAIQFSPHGGAVEVSGKTAGKFSEITVRDHGSGIDPNKIQQIVEPFSKGTSVEAFNQEGLGLSLYTDQIILSKRGGQLQIKSSPDNGTTVTLRIPYEKTRAVKAPVVIRPMPQT